MYLKLKKTTTKRGISFRAEIEENKRTGKATRTRFVAYICTLNELDFATTSGRLRFWLLLESVMENLGLNETNRRQIRKSASRRIQPVARPASALPLLAHSKT